MLDYQRIVDDVRSSLYTDGGGGMDFLRAAAADYSVACEEANERLHQCGALLRQGLRSEAIQLAEMEPNLLDVVALLDFPEREQWIETSQQSGMAAPTPLMLDVAGELNEAYAIEQPLASLLQTHRLLALAHGPLPLRIRILRRLAEMDANNTVWQEDLETFERERQKQLQAEVEKATSAGDLDALKALDAELSSPDWIYPPTPTLAKMAAESLARQQYWAVQGQLEKLADELNSAASRCQPELARTLRSRWEEIVASSGREPYAQVAQRVAPAFEWLSVQDDLLHKRQEREAALADLERAVGGQRSAAKLEKLYALATKSGKLSDDLEDRYRARLARCKRADLLRRGLIGTGIAAVVAIVIILIGMIVSHERRERLIASTVQDLPFLLEHKQYERAEALVRDLPPAIKEDSRILQSIVSLQDKLKKEKNRQASFSQQLGTVTHWLDQVAKSLAAEPQQSVLDNLRAELNRIEKDIAKAKSLARSDLDYQQTDAAQDLATQLNEKWQSQIDKAFLARFEEFDKRLTQIERDKSASREAVEAMLKDCRTELKQWEAVSSGVSPALVPRIRTIGQRLFAFGEELQRRGRQERDAQQITAAVGDIPAFAKALQDYSERNPSAECAADFKRVADESLCWQAVEEWNKLAAPLRKAGQVGEEQLALANAVSENFADCEECKKLRDLLPYIKAMAQRNNGGERIETRLKKLFADPLVAGAWMVEIKPNGAEGAQRYYFLDRPKVNRDTPENITFQYVTSFDGKMATGWLKPNSKVASVGHAPQKDVAEKVRPVLDALNDENWDASFCQIIAAIHADQAIDPILKVNLLQQVLDTGIRGSDILEKAFVRHLEWIKEARINAFANWLDPVNQAVAIDRETAARKLKNFPDINKAVREVAQSSNHSRRLPEFRWVGWLHRNGGGSWECLMKSTPNIAGPLFVACRQAAGGKPNIQEIGRLSHAGVVIDGAATTTQAEGRPVYLKMP